MAVLSFCERFSIFLSTWVFSAMAMPFFGIFKPIFLLCVAIQNFMRPRNSPERHAANVKYVQKQVLDWIASGRKTQMCTGRPGWRALSIRTGIYKDTMTGIHVDMDDMVSLDPVKRTVTMEPLMTMGRLTSVLLPMGWTIPVVPELNDLTVGGLVCGAGLETSSHKYGLIHNICVSFEIVLSSGEVVVCSKDHHSDLYYAIPGSCGTLGFVTAVELMIIPAQKYVKLEYIPVHSLDEAIATFETQTYRETGNEFVEGFMYSLDKGVIMVGNMTDEADPRKINSVMKWYKPWFYKHVETFLSKTKKDKNKERFIEYIPLRHYYHRHTKSLFWETEHFIPYGNHVVFRYLLGWILPLRVYILKLIVGLSPKWLQETVDRNHVTQDFVVPLGVLKESLLLTHDVMRVYPIWLCPCKMINTPGALKFLGAGDEMYVDFGVYGMTTLDSYDLVKSAREMELFCIKNRGYQSLYSDVCMTKEEFGQMFDGAHYLKVRTALNCFDAFPDIYDKVCRAARR